MLNHWHALLVPQDSAGRSLSEIRKRLKERTAIRIRTSIGGVGPIWQGEWFDRWVRDETEWTKMVAYVQNNPVKAGLAGAINEHPWTR
jgi:REP element-mobilizing transposase RayT